MLAGSLSCERDQMMRKYHLAHFQQVLKEVFKGFNSHILALEVLYFIDRSLSSLDSSSVSNRISNQLATMKGQRFQVWILNLVLDAAEVDHPEASPAIVEVYSLRIVPKKLTGKPRAGTVLPEASK
ncbi:hypothetical protein Droror1_Dr00012197 [Drosera rotundifolia]